MALAAEPERTVRAPLFFFGTLMDTDVLGVVLARPVAAVELVPALLWEYRRHAVVGAPYPVLRRHRDGHVQGRLFEPCDADERARIDHFESNEYVAAPIRVQAGTRMLDAHCYLDLEGVFQVLPDDWSLHRFQTSAKAGYLEACHAWMADCATVGRA